jgi:PAS domain S-box-containing protein
MNSTIPGNSPTGEVPVSVPAPSDAAEQRQSAVLALGRRAIVSPGAEVLMQDAALLLAETLGCAFCSVARLEGFESVAVKFSAGSSGKFADEWTGSQDPAKSLVGHALSVARPVVIADLDSENRFLDPNLKKRSLRSALCAPLKVADDAFGALAVYTPVPRSFSKQDVQFVETIAHIVTMTIARERAETALADARRFTEALLTSVEAVVVVLSPDGRITDLNKSAERITGFTLQEVKQRPIWSVFLVPEEAAKVKSQLQKLGSASVPLALETFVLTKQADRKRIDWTFVVTRDTAGNVESLLGTGIDITEKKQLENLLEQSNKTLEKLRSAGVSVDGDRPAEDGESAERPFARINEQGTERRDKPRRNFPYIQLIAPIKDGKLPQRSAFREIRCRDIAAGGFSFLTPEQPADKELVVAFGVGTNLTFLTARIVHRAEQIKDGKKLYLIGCQYTGRAKYE